jgi:hypothetical protein
MSRLGFLAVSFLVCCSTAVLAQSAPPTVYLSAQPYGNVWDGERDPAQEMAKDFARHCPAIQVSTDKQADYGVRLNHVETGQKVMDSRFTVVDGMGNVLGTREFVSMGLDVKSICEFIAADWNNEEALQARLVKSFNDAFAKNSVEGYAELKARRLVIHSARANDMRFHMILNSSVVVFARQAGVQAIRYTNDGTQDWTYDLATDQIAKTDKNAEGSDAPGVQTASQLGEANLAP